MKSESFALVTTDGVSLNGHSWLPDEEGDPKVVVCVIHGFSEHLGRYETFAEFFTSQGIAVMAMDLRGHGHSPGKRGHVQNFDLFFDDVESLLIEARRNYNDALLFLFGQSFGGNIIANYLTRKNSSELGGAILSAPWFKLAFDPPALKVRLASIMKRIYPAYTEKSDLKGEKLSKDKKVAKAYDQDPLVHNRITAGLFFSTITQGEAVLEQAFKITIPILAIHGKEDTITSLEATEKFVKNAGEKSSIILYDGVKHEPHNDLERITVLNDLLHWIKDQSK